MAQVSGQTFGSLGGGGAHGLILPVSINTNNGNNLSHLPAQKARHQFGHLRWTTQPQVAARCPHGAHKSPLQNMSLQVEKVQAKGRESSGGYVPSLDTTQRSHADAGKGAREKFA